jgi:hypothetical protein
MEEYEEVELKARRLLQAVAAHKGTVSARTLMNGVHHIHVGYCPLPLPSA